MSYPKPLTIETLIIFDLDLTRILERCNGDLDTVPDFSWTDELSPGEMQRLCFARFNDCPSMTSHLLTHSKKFA
jgi:hypothetical protein